jgi:predicted component of type VI protein secretion system
MSNLRLVVRQGPRAGQGFELQQPVISIGRSKENDIQIDDPKMSRRHASLTSSPTGYTVQDLGSTNGTFVNNMRITMPTIIQPGDVIGFGDTVVLDVQGSAEAVKTVATARPALGTPPAPMASYGSPSSGIYASPQAAYIPPPPPPPLPNAPASHTGRTLAIGCGILLVLVVCSLTLFFLAYQYAPPEIAGPVCDALRPLPGLGSFCP